MTDGCVLWLNSKVVLNELKFLKHVTNCHRRRSVEYWYVKYRQIWAFGVNKHIKIPLTLISLYVKYSFWYVGIHMSGT